MSIAWVVGGQNSGSAAIAYSTNGQIWTNASNAATIFGSNVQQNSIAHNGTIWVAGGTPSGGSSTIGYSYDANTWFASPSGKAIINLAVGGIAYGNGRFVAVGTGTNDNIMYSDDGINWTACGKPFSTGYGMGVVYRNSTWVAFGGGSPTTKNIATSTNGITWTLASSTNFTEVDGIDWNGTNWVVTGAATPDCIMYTANITGALSGTGVGNCFGNRGRCVCWNGTKFIAGGISNALLKTSTDGVTWSTVNSAKFASGTGNNGGILGINFKNGIWLAGQTSSGNGQSVLYSSDNGVTWNNTTTSVFPSGQVWSISYALPPPPPPYPCFLEGSKILRYDYETDRESYVPIETLRRGDLIKTSLSGYKAIAYIGHTELKNPASDTDAKNRLYKFSKKTCPGVFQELCITGEHCTLRLDITEEHLMKIKDHMGDIYVTEKRFRCPACLDERATPYKDDSPVTIWHFALEHENAYYNYGVWANGLLVESCSIEHLVQRSNMELI